jgi:hypothetical protein
MSKSTRNKLIVFTVLILIMGIIFAWESKPLIKQYVRNHYIELNEFAENMVKNSKYGESGTYNGWKLQHFSNTNTVIFTIKGWGIGSSTVYKGIFYSHEDKPSDFDGREGEFAKTDAGWEWRENGGDNRLYVEKIMDRWYWFEAYY